MKKILLVEDDSSLRKEIRSLFEKSPYRMIEASNLKEASVGLEEYPDLVVLDRTLPDGEGLTWLLQQRKRQWTVPVLLLTARDSVLEKVSGLEMGANDYLTKPFDPLELVARVRVLLKETLNNFVGTQELHYGDFTYDPEVRSLKIKGSEVKILTPIEGKFLAYLMERPGQVFQREELLERVWEVSSSKETRAVDNVVAELRKFLGPETIETIRGKGYRLRSILASEKRTT